MAVQAGLRVRNKDRVLQIDGEYQNHELVSKIDYTIPATGSGGSDMWGSSVDIPFPPGRENVILAVSTQALNGVYVVRIGASTFRVYKGSLNTQATTFTAYVFAVPYERDMRGGIGLVVRSRTTGKMVYNSNYRYLRIMNFANVNLPMPADANAPVPGQSFTHAGKKLAIVQCVRPNGRRATPGGNPQQPIGIFGFFGGTMRNTGDSTAIVEHRVIASAVGPPASWVAQQNIGTYMIIDVTGF